MNSHSRYIFEFPNTLEGAKDAWKIFFWSCYGEWRRPFHAKFKSYKEARLKTIALLEARKSGYHGEPTWKTQNERKELEAAIKRLKFSFDF